MAPRTGSVRTMASIVLLLAVVCRAAGRELQNEHHLNRNSHRDSREVDPEHQLAALMWLPRDTQVTLRLPKKHALEHTQQQWEEKSQSQDAEDLFAHKNFFYGIHGGTYLEMGALDGVYYSNTHLFHHYLGWRGLMIEASPQSFAQLVKNRPEDICINLAACGEARTVHYIGEGNYSATRGIYEFMSAEFLDRWHPDQFVSVDLLPTIPCIPLMSVFLKLGIDHIDFFSLDVEGAELEVLKTIDFARVSFDVILFENQWDPEHGHARDTAIGKLLEEHGYVRHGLEKRNYWYVHGSFKPSRAPHLPPREA